jgi:hypothetical protein
MQRQDSSTSLATVNIGVTSGDGGTSLNDRSSFQTGDDVIDDISLSGASVTLGSAAAAAVAAADAASTADSASSFGIGQVCVWWDVCLKILPAMHCIQEIVWQSQVAPFGMHALLGRSLPRVAWVTCAECRCHVCCK